MSDKKFVWVLTEKINAEGDGIDKVKTAVYSDFEKAKGTMRDRMRKQSTCDNMLFDGEGRIKGLREYFEEHIHDGDEEFFEENVLDTVRDLHEKLRVFFIGEKKEITFSDFEWTDWLAECKYSQEDGTLEMYGVDDGPCNGIDPKIVINTFDMSDPDKTYTVQIRNAGLEDTYSEEYGEYCLTLVKTEVDAAWENTAFMAI